MPPQYDLTTVKRLISERRFHVTQTARMDALALGFDSSDVRECIAGLDEAVFYKSMPAEKAIGLWQDVYRLSFRGQRVYVKLQIDRVGRAVIISFKADTGISD